LWWGGEKLLDSVVICVLVVKAILSKAVTWKTVKEMGG
jgi:hypothetical protein